MVYDNVVQYCKENKLSISGFEKLCGLANGTVRLWKNGGYPRLSTLQKMIEATNIPLQKWLEQGR
jgi:transcriptional regulator with XRE-family HTH domain